MAKCQNQCVLEGEVSPKQNEPSKNPKVLTRFRQLSLGLKIVMKHCSFIKTKMKPKLCYCIKMLFKYLKAELDLFAYFCVQLLYLACTCCFIESREKTVDLNSFNLTT